MLLPLLSPEQTGGNLGALRKAQHGRPRTGARIGVHGGTAPVEDELGGVRPVDGRVVVFEAQPAVKGPHVTEEGDDGFVSGRGEGRVDEDEAEAGLETGDDGAALDAEDFGVDAAAVEAQDAGEGGHDEECLDGYDGEEWRAREKEMRMRVDQRGTGRYGSTGDRNPR